MGWTQELVLEPKLGRIPIGFGLGSQAAGLVAAATDLGADRGLGFGIADRDDYSSQGVEVDTGLVVELRAQ